MQTLAIAHNSTGQWKEAKKVLINVLTHHPNHEQSILLSSEINARLQKLHNLNNPMPEYNEREILYSDACRGLLKQDEAIVSKLNCRYEMKSTFSKIAPFKVQEANLEPYIWCFMM